MAAGSADGQSSNDSTDVRSAYTAKLCTPEAAAKLVRRVDTVAVPIATGQPCAFLDALGKRHFDDLTLFGGLIVEPYEVLRKPEVRLVSGFFGPLERLLRGEGANIQYLPADFLGWERYARESRPRVVASAVAPMDERGFFSLGLHAGATFEALRSACRDPQRIAVCEVVSDMPQAFGIGRFGGHRVHVSEVDCVIESDRKAFQLPPNEPSEEDRRIAAFVEQLVQEGATLQIGIGAVPNIVAELLAEGGKGDFGVHTEMLVDGILRLHQAGKVTNHKGIFDGHSIATFAAGSRELYDWMHLNPEVRLLPVSQVNDPAIIRRNRLMVSINGAMAVDLSGQIMADTIGPRQYSGVGGHELFVMGAADSPGGRSIICLRSTANVDGQPVSTIVRHLALGTRVTTPRHHVQYVVTEHGIADLDMKTDGERADTLIEIAHPDFREELRRED